MHPAMRLLVPSQPQIAEQRFKLLLYFFDQLRLFFHGLCSLAMPIFHNIPGSNR